MSQLIIKQDYLIANSVISNNTEFKFLTPVIKWVQLFKLKRLLGTNLYDLIITQTTPTPTLTTENQYLVDNYILDYMVFYIMSESVMTLKYKYTNIGVVSRDTSSQGASSISPTEAKELMDFYKNKAEQIGEEMINYIKNNSTLYPTYFTNTGLGNVIPDGESFSTQMYLPPLNHVDSRNDAGDLKV